LTSNQLHENIAARRRLANARWSVLAAERPDLGRAIELQQRLLGRQLSLLELVGPELESALPPPESAVLHLLADRFPVLRGRIGSLPVDILVPTMVALAEDIAGVSGYAAARRVGEVIATSTLDVPALLAHVYQRDQDAVRQMAADAHLVVDLLWLLGDLVVAPGVHLEQVGALREGVSDSPVRDALERWDQGYCPACGSWPALAEFFSGERLLRCAFCAAMWRLSIDGCVFCGERGDNFRAIVPDRQRPGRRLELCRGCGGFLKTIGVEQQAPFPLVAIDDLGSSDLDQAALSHGFRRLALPKLRAPA
jgi:hypothetical protein